MLALLACTFGWLLYHNYMTSSRLNRNAELIENVAALSKHNTKLLDAIIEMKKQEAEDRAARHGTARHETLAARTNLDVIQHV
jgi:hypothetical protein